MELDELHQRLKQIQDEFSGPGNSTKEFMTRLEKLAKEIRSEAVRIFGEEDEVTSELESAILLSKDFDLKVNDFQKEFDLGALIHFQYGITLFLNRFEI